MTMVFVHDNKNDNSSNIGKKQNNKKPNGKKQQKNSGKKKKTNSKHQLGGKYNKKNGMRKGNHHPYNNNHNKRRKKPQLWIENAKGTNDGAVKGDVTIIITRVELEENLDNDPNTEDSKNTLEDGSNIPPLSFHSVPNKKKVEEQCETKRKKQEEISNQQEEGTETKKACCRQDDENSQNDKTNNHIFISNQKSNNTPNNNDDEKQTNGTNDNSTSNTTIIGENKKEEEQQKSQSSPETKSNSSIVVVRSPEAQGKTKWALQQPPPQQRNNNNNHHHLPNGDCGDGIINPYPKSKVPDKFWAQRRRLFHKFHDGIQLDEEGWYSVTPEVIACHIASKVSHRRHCLDNDESQPSGCVIMDAFCGCGGDAIAFAKNPNVSLVVAIDTDFNKLRMASNNARIYDIPSDKIIFLHANAIDCMNRYQNGTFVPPNHTDKEEETKEQPDSKKETQDIEICHGFPIGGIHLLPPLIDCIFLSPPWGGMEYIGVGMYDIQKCIHVSTNDTPPNQQNDSTIDGETLLQYAMAASTDQNVIYFLPRNINGRSLARSALNGGYTHGIFEMEQNVILGKTKTVTAYFGKLLQYAKL